MDESALWRALDRWYAGDAAPAPAVRAALAARPDAARVLRRWLLSRGLRAALAAPGTERPAVAVAAAWLAYQGLITPGHKA
jgi:hypothetical protein